VGFEIEPDHEFVVPAAREVHLQPAGCRTQRKGQRLYRPSAGWPRRSRHGLHGGRGSRQERRA
jgi:hypothetical protein